MLSLIGIFCTAFSVFDIPKTPKPLQFEILKNIKKEYEIRKLIDLRNLAEEINKSSILSKLSSVNLIPF
jgi:hypothetical protein